MDHLNFIRGLRGEVVELRGGLVAPDGTVVSRRTAATEAGGRRDPGLELTRRIAAELAADQAYARQIITKAEGLFNGLANEAPPNVAAALHNITAQEQAVLGEMSTFGSLTQIKAQEHKLTTDPAYLNSIRVLVQYMATKCG